MAIGYTPQTWVNGTAPALSAANLQTMDNGINSACDAIDALDAAGIKTAPDAKTTPVGADEALVRDSAAGNVVKKITLTNLSSAWGVLVAALTGKTTPIDADTVLLADSAASNVSKSVTWANIKATLATAFKHGGSNEIATATAAANAIPKSGSGSTLAKEWLPAATTSAQGAVTLAADDGTTASTVVQATDSRLAQATESHRGTAELATAAEIVTGTDTARVPNVANLKTSLSSDGMWLTKRTKMPDGATAQYSEDFASGTGGWGAFSSTLSNVSSALRISASGTSSFYGTKAGVSTAGGVTVLLRVKLSGLSSIRISFGAVVGPVFNIGSSYAVIPVMMPVGSTRIDVESYGTVASGVYIDIDWIWVGDYSYLTGSLSEEAARIADQLGDSAGVGVAASGTLISDGTNPDPNSTVTIAGKVYTFVTSISATRVEGEVKIGTTADDTQSYLRTAILRSSPSTYDYNGTNPLYNCAAAHPLVTGVVGGTSTSTIRSLTTGELGNSITLAASSGTGTNSHITPSGSTLTGGYSDAAAKIITAVGNNIAGSGTRPAAAKIDITSTSLIGYEQAVDVASGGTTTLPAGGTWVWFVYGHGATISSAKRGSSAGGTTLTVAGANATVWYRRYA